MLIQEACVYSDYFVFYCMTMPSLFIQTLETVMRYIRAV